MSQTDTQLRLATESIPGARPYQEDAVLTRTLPDGRVLLAVADGMGGHAAGDVASALALETLLDALEEGRALEEAFHRANERVHARAQEPDKAGMGTTLVAMLLEDEEYRVANVGDSRGYLVTGDGIRRITEDHSFVAEAVKRGESEDRMRESRWKDVLTRSIGNEPEVEVDTFGPFPVEPDSAVILCSDGLYKTLEDDDLLDLFRRSGGPRAASQTMVSTALERGSDDNITMAVAEFGEVPRSRPSGTMPLKWEDGAEEDGEPGAGVPPPEGGPAPEVGAGATEPVPGNPRKGRGIPMGAVLTVVVLAVAALVLVLLFG
jgi:protein phosphatase